MEDQGLARETTHQQSAYSVIVYPGISLPEEYKSLIFSKWMRSLKFGNDYFRLIDNDSYYQNYQRYIEVLLNRANTFIKLAVLSDDFDVVLGFSAIQDHTLHYVHVHKDNRHQGIGTALIPKDIAFLSHVTKIGLSIWNNKYPHWKFNPFA